MKGLEGLKGFEMFNYIAENGKVYEIRYCSLGWYGYNEDGSFISDRYFDSLDEIEEFCDKKVDA